MANTTIYPYGTNGELPGSIGIINDLTTGGADSALSAEMGKRLSQQLNGTIISFTGAANNWAKNLATGLTAKGGHTYRFTPTDANWAHSAVTSTANALGIGYLSGSTEVNIYTISARTWQLMEYYDITYPDAADGLGIIIGGRANSGTVVSFTVTDITEEMDGKRRQLVASSSMGATITSTTNTVYLPIDIKAGEKYVFHYKWPYGLVPLGGGSVTSSGLKIWTTNTTADDTQITQLLLQVLYQSGSFQEEFIEFVASADAHYIAFYCRLLSTTLECKMEAGTFPNGIAKTYDGVTRYYSGEKISIRPICPQYNERVFSLQGIGTYQSHSSQGFAIYGKYGFMTYDTGYIQVINMDTREIVSSFAMPTGVQGSNNHAGMANFAYTLSSASDTFPLLYISSYLENTCYVLRVTTSTASLVQKITMANAYHFFVDDDGQMIVHMSDNSYLIFDIPDPTGGDVTLVASDAKDSFSFTYANHTFAGALCQGGKMYALSYYNSVPSGVVGMYDGLISYDYVKKAMVSEIVFKDLSIRSIEFEGLAINSDGEFVLSFNGADQLAVLKV